MVQGVEEAEMGATNVERLRCSTKVYVQISDMILCTSCFILTPAR